MGNPVVHFEVTGKDGQALQSFYKDAFGWVMDSVMPTYAMVYPGNGIDGGVGAAMFGEGCATFYVEVADLEETLRTIERLGGKRIAGPMDVPGGPSVAMFCDPEGHAVGLVKAGSGTAR